MKTKSLFFKAGSILAVMALLLATPLAGAFAGSSAEADSSAGASAGSSAFGGNQGQGQAVDLRFAGTKIPKPAARAPSVVAPGLTASMVNTCLGSESNGFSAGIVGIAAGATSGKTVQDAPCNARMDAQMWFNFGEPAIATARLCEQSKNRAAAMAAGKPCPQDIAELTKEKKAAISWLNENRQKVSLQAALLTPANQVN